LAPVAFAVVSIQFQGGLASGRRPVVKIIANYLSQHDKKHFVPTSLSGIRVRNIRVRKRRTLKFLYNINLSQFNLFVCQTNFHHKVSCTPLRTVLSGLLDA
jgi:hypothetical protein